MLKELKIENLAIIEKVDLEIGTRSTSEQMDFFVVISGRRVDLDNGHYMDYIGHGYPFGLRFDTSPLFLSNLFIKRVVSEGYSDTVDNH